MALARMLVGAACLIGLFAGPAEAHFIWIGIGRFQPTAQIWFNERPAPGEPELIQRIRGTQAWVRTVDGRQLPLAL
ncbi:MAG TPA: hypothetical protein VHY20_10765, partial [Pirellulales bacterium]|nr:hypothetical protein [Pirellulales bacterium]